jgi:hypothetical protein
MKDIKYVQDALKSGFILYGIDSPSYSSWSRNNSFYNLHWFKREITHEMMHVYQYNIGISPFVNIDLWFHEGLAEYISGGAFETIDNTEELAAWCNIEGHSNPISIHRVEDFPIDYRRSGEYYPTYHLAVSYLLDKRGFGKTLTEVKNMFHDLTSSGTSFENAFQTYMGISLNYFEEHYFELMTNFLNSTSTYTSKIN